MKAIGYKKSLPIDNEASLEDIELPDPTPGPRDLLVEVHAVSVNPVDTKVRMRAEPDEGHKVIGWDASGVVRSVGAEVTLFAPGDAVFYAGALDRPGTNSALHVVDERIVGRKPASLDHAEAAALPLTAITAWELLFDRLGVAENGGEGETLLIAGGAGGVGSILVQIARQLTALTIVATASREETTAWCRKMGAHEIVDHHGDVAGQLGSLGLSPRYIASLTGTEQNFAALASVLAPQGKLALIDDPDPASIDISLLKQKAGSLHWEFMFTRSMFRTADMIEQHRLLNRVSALVDDGALVTTMRESFGTVNAANLRKAHAHQESGKAIGKSVLAGF